MKMALLTLVLSAVSASAFAAAPQPKAYPAESIALLEAASHCPTELQSLMKTGRLNGATLLDVNDNDTYTIDFVTGGCPPAFVTSPAGKLVITRSFQRSNVMAPDAPGGAFVFTCTISK